MSSMQSPIPPGSPEVEQADVQDVFCPLCEYNLRGLREPVCPECGHRFEWSELLDPARRKHPFVFEHHPDRKVWSYARTAIAGLRPRRFWSSLLPVQPSFPRRLFLYWLITAAIVLTVPVCMMATAIIDRVNLISLAAQQNRAFASTLLGSSSVPANLAQAAAKYPSTQAYLDAVYPTPRALNVIAGATVSTLASPEWYFLMFVPLIWPWFTVGFLMIFSEDRRRARVRMIHVVRCVVYSYDIMIWIVVPLITLWLDQFVFNRLIASQEQAAWATVAMLTFVFLVMTCRLAVAFRRYLRVPWGVTAVILSQFVWLLAVPAGGSLLQALASLL